MHKGFDPNEVLPQLYIAQNAAVDSYTATGDQKWTRRDNELTALIEQLELELALMADGQTHIQNASLWNAINKLLGRVPGTSKAKITIAKPDGTPALVTTTRSSWQTYGMAAAGVAVGLLILWGLAKEQ